MKQKLKQIITIMTTMLLIISTKVFALQSTKLFTGTVNMFNDATTIALIILPILSGLLFLYCQIMKNTAEPDEQKRWKKWQTAIIIGVIIGETFIGVLNVILSYYQ